MSAINNLNTVHRIVSIQVETPRFDDTMAGVFFDLLEGGNVNDVRNSLRPYLDNFNELSRILSLQDEYGRTALFIAVMEGHTELVRFLIDLGASIREVDEFGFLPLHQACFIENDEIVHCLIEAGADVDALDDEGKSALDHALERRAWGLLELFLNHTRCLAFNGSKTPWLHRIIHTEKLDLIKLCLSRKVDINTPDFCTGNHPLHFAVQTGNINIVTYLLEQGACFETVNAKGYPSLLIAKMCGRKSLYTCLKTQAKLTSPLTIILSKRVKSLVDLAHLCHVGGRHQGVKVTGYPSSKALHVLGKSFEKSQDISGDSFLSSVSITDLRQALEFSSDSILASPENILTRLKEKKPVFMEFGYHHHSVSLLLYPDSASQKMYLFIGNRGARSQQALEAMIVEDLSEWTTQSIRDIELVKMCSSKEYLKKRQTVLDQIGAKYIPLNEQLKSICKLPKQTVGNCSFQSLLTNIWLWFHMNESNVEIDEKTFKEKEISFNCYLTGWKLAELKKYMSLFDSSNEDDQMKFAHGVIKEVFADITRNFAEKTSSMSELLEDLEAEYYSRFDPYIL